MSTSQIAAQRQIEYSSLGNNQSDDELQNAGNDIATRYIPIIQQLKRRLDEYDKRRRVQVNSKWRGWYLNKELARYRLDKIASPLLKKIEKWINNPTDDSLNTLTLALERSIQKNNDETATFRATSTFGVGNGSLNRIMQLALRSLPKMHRQGVHLQEPDFPLFLSDQYQSEKRESYA